MLSLLYSQIGLPLIAQIIGRVSHGSKEGGSLCSPDYSGKVDRLYHHDHLWWRRLYALLNQNIIPQGIFSALTVMACAIFFVLGASLFFIFTNEERREFVNTMLKTLQLGILKSSVFH